MSCQPEGNVHVGGFWDFECFNPDGSLAWKERVKNGVTAAGLNSILNVYFNSSAQLTTWFLGLIDNAGFSGLSVNDTMALHPGWAESTAYSGGRAVWAPTVSGSSATNTTSASFTLTGTATINGGFLVSDGTAGGTGGVLWATGSFSSTQSLVPGQVLKVTYTCNAAGS